jgi:hypothetical protein
VFVKAFIGLGAIAFLVIEYLRLIEEFSSPHSVWGLELSGEAACFLALVAFFCFVWRHYGKDIVDDFIDTLRVLEALLRKAVRCLKSVRQGLQKFAKPEHLSRSTVLVLVGMIGAMYVTVLSLNSNTRQHHPSKGDHAEVSSPKVDSPRVDRIARRFNPDLDTGGPTDHPSPVDPLMPGSRIEWTLDAVPDLRIERFPGQWKDFSMPNLTGRVGNLPGASGPRWVQMHVKPWPGVRRFVGR